MNRGLLATKDELARLSDRIGRKPFDHIYETLRNRCGLILESSPITETMWRASWQQGRWGAATAAIADIQGRLFDLIISHNIDSNPAYRDRAVEELKNLLRFSSWVDPGHKDMHADLCTGEACATVAVALDWLAEELTQADRTRCRRALREKGLLPYLKAVESGAFWHSCYHNWNAVVNSGVALAGLLLADEEDAAEAVLAKARPSLSNFFNALGREGGWDEGLGYWGYAMRYLLLLGEALSRVAKDNFIFRQRGMDTTGLFPIYFSPHGLPVSFGDRPIAPTWGVFYLLVKHYGLKEMAWWLDRHAFRHDVSTTDYSDAGLSLLFRPTDWEPNPPPDLQPIRAFNEIGWAAAADRWPMPQVYVALKTGDLSAHHAQLDMNSVQIMFEGEIFLHDPGNPDFSYEYLFSDRRYRFYEVQSRSHNTLTAAQREHRIDAVGSVVEAQQGPNYRWIAGDAGGALGENVHFIRHLVIPVTPGGVGRMVVVFDEVHNTVPEEVHAAWHSGGELTMDEGRLSGVIAGETTSMYFAFAADCPIGVESVRQSMARRRTDNVLLLRTPRKRQLALVSVFSPRPVGKIALRRSSGGRVDLRIGRLRVHWRPSRKYLQLEQIEEKA
ncbi:MAG: hypothetical protein AMJ81_01485 [Phycisphaerae bacterium SM23_33]|nr:MAG: hypothetical protein AMJ81_01485 [Phycisphaerae bacterium SM23_33]